MLIVFGLENGKTQYKTYPVHFFPGKKFAIRAGLLLNNLRKQGGWHCNLVTTFFQWGEI